MNGEFFISFPPDADTLTLGTVGFEVMRIKVPANCDRLEIILMGNSTYDFMSREEINWDRKRRYKKISVMHKEACAKEIFTSDAPCFKYVFTRY